MTKCNRYVLLIVLLFVTARGAFPQIAATSEVGANPYKSYSGGDIDHIQMQNGSLYLRIPLLSYPQLGKLKLSFSLLANGPQFQEEADCDSYGTCEFWYAYNRGFNCQPGGIADTGTGEADAQVVVDQDLSLTSCFRDPVEAVFECNPTADDPIMCTNSNLFTVFGVIDSTDATHTLGYNQSNWSVLQATDGSGYTVQMPWGNSLNAVTGSYGAPSTYPGMCGTSTVISDSSGVKQTASTTCTPSGSLATSAITISDPVGNHIQRSSFPLTANIVDSVGRQIPDPTLVASYFYPDPTIPTGLTLDPPSVTSTICPPLGMPGEPGVAGETVVYSESWTVPGYQNSPETYHFCYTTVNIATNFFGDGPGKTVTQEGPTWRPDPFNGGGVYLFVTYQDMSGTSPVLQAVVLPNKTYWGFVYDTASSSNPESYGDLLQVILPSGGSINYRYGWITICGSTAAGEPQPVGRAVQTRTLEPLVGEPVTTTYSYFQASGTRANPATIETDGYGNDTVHTFTLDYPNWGDMVCGAEETATKWYQGSSSNGISGTILKEVENTYTYEMNPQEDVSDSPQRINVLPQTTTTLLNGQVESSVSYNYDTLFTASQPYQSSSGVCWPTGLCGTGVFPTSSPIRYQTPSFVDDGIKQTTTIRLARAQPWYQAANFLALPQSVTVADELGNQVSQTVYGYDEPPCSPSAASGNFFGNLTSVTKDYGTKTSWCYNNNAMPTSTTNPNGNAGLTNGTTYYSYLSATYPVLYITKVQAPTTNGVAHIRYYQQDPNTGWTTGISDENASSINDTHHATYYSYDPVGRLIQVKYPDGGLATQCYTDEGAIAGITSCSQTSAPYSVVLQQPLNQSQTLTSTAMYDGLGRPYQAITPSSAITYTTYDLDGRVASVSNPHYATASFTDGITSYLYDPLGRKTFQCQPDNLPINSTTCSPNNSYQSWSYNGNTTTFRDEDGNQWRRNADALGRLISVLEPNGVAQAPGMETDYSYDALNNLFSVTQWGGPSGSSGARTRSFTYDNLSRLLSATNPETGRVSYVYDPNSNVTSKTDARNVTTTYRYDALNRLLSKSYSDGATAFSCYQYDASSASCVLPSPNSIGRLTNQWTQSSSAGSCLAPTGGFLTKRSILCYDPMGRILNEQQYTPASQAAGTSYPLAYTYDLAGNLLISTSGVGPTSTPANPAPITFTNTYDGAGRLQTLTSSWTNNGVFPVTLFSPPTAMPSTPCANAITAQYAPFGGLANAAFGNGLTLNRAYDKRLRTTCENDVGTGTTPATSGSATVTITGSEQTK